MLLILTGLIQLQQLLIISNWRRVIGGRAGEASPLNTGASTYEGIQRGFQGSSDFITWNSDDTVGWELQKNPTLEL